MKIKIRKFDPTNMKRRNILILGGNKTGKNWLVKDLLNHMSNDTSHIIVHKSTIHKEYNIINPIYENENKNDIDIHNRGSNFQTNTIGNIINHQKQMVSQLNRTYGNTSTMKNTVLVFDNMIYNNDWVYDKNIKYVALNSRHFKIPLIISMPYKFELPKLSTEKQPLLSPVIRCNMDYIFIFNDDDIKKREEIYLAYCNIIPSFDIFCQILDGCTKKNYECMVLDISACFMSKKIKDYICWYKAKPVDKIVIGNLPPSKTIINNEQHYEDKPPTYEEAIKE